MRALRRFPQGYLAVFCATALILGSCATVAPPQSVTTPLRGVTLESLDDVAQSVRLLAESPTRLTVRVVMDVADDPANYVAAMARIHDRAQVMMQIVDSEQMAELSAADIAGRTRRMVQTVGKWVDMWEVGNEINGAWVGSGPADINAKVAAAYDVIARTGKPTALTLNYWSSRDCYEEDWEDTMRFARTVTIHPDYVFLSIYETACEPPQHPTTMHVADMLIGLGTVFPHAHLGIGEVGAQNRSDGQPRDPGLAEKQQLAHYYYGMHHTLRTRVGSRFVGGYFWWYFHADAVRGDLWPTLREVTSNLSDGGSGNCDGLWCAGPPHSG